MFIHRALQCTKRSALARADAGKKEFFFLAKSELFLKPVRSSEPVLGFFSLLLLVTKHVAWLAMDVLRYRVAKDVRRQQVESRALQLATLRARVQTLIHRPESWL
jgi:hypothetical protein